jgi:hypothetical protein
MDKKSAEVRRLEQNKIRLEDKLRRIETGEDRTPEQKKEIMEILTAIATGLGVYISSIFVLTKAREKNPDKFKEYGF